MIITMLAGFSKVSKGPSINAFSSSMAFRRATRAAVMFGSMKRLTGVSGSKDGVERPFKSRYESTLAVFSAMIYAKIAILFGCAIARYESLL